MFKDLQKQMYTISEQIGNFSKDMETVKKEVFSTEVKVNQQKLPRLQNREQKLGDNK